MGIELDVLVGHPEHELLFVATQVGHAAGLKDATGSTKQSLRTMQRQGQKGGIQLKELINKPEFSSALTDAICIAALKVPRWRDMWFMGEESLYAMLLRGHSPKSEPFRRWVTEEVLPTIRKTGKYDAEQSTNPIAVDLT
ncbi:BRO-N domain-containing protein [Pseudomonas cichorii]|uniref:BRO-N domain-containing protein n=1 Tax=Pseudomonas cichorii TaxID=36746 RepID=UPI001910BEE1|nr:BRO family protein [Pseudomonas cichorii]